MIYERKSDGPLIGCVLILSLVGCSGEYDRTIEFSEMPGLNQFAMLIPADLGRDEMVVAAKDKCGNNDICSIFGWRNKVDMARALPMTDRELKTLSFSYTINRTTGFERSLWNCDIYPKKNRDECL